MPRFAPRFDAWFDRGRRAASVLLVVLVLVAAPAVAEARFTTSRAVGLGVGTDRMETPVGITGGYRCTRSGSTEGVSVSVTTFTDNGPVGATYGFTLALAGAVKDTASSPIKAQTLDGSRPNDGSGTTWTLTVQSRLGSWTSPVGAVEVGCAANGKGSGTF